jgi:hypothetical protein
MWIGHVCRMPPDSNTADGKRNRGRPKETWRRSVEKEMKANRLAKDNISKMAQNQGGWRSRVDALCAITAPKKQ